MLAGTTKQTLKYRTKFWVEKNDNTKAGSYEVADQIKFWTTMIRSCSWYYNDAYILLKGTISITGSEADTTASQADERNILKYCTINI